MLRLTGTARALPAERFVRRPPWPPELPAAAWINTGSSVPHAVLGGTASYITGEERIVRTRPIAGGMCHGSQSFSVRKLCQQSRLLLCLRFRDARPGRRARHRHAAIPATPGAEDLTITHIEGFRSAGADPATPQAPSQPTRRRRAKQWSDDRSSWPRPFLSLVSTIFALPLYIVASNVLNPAPTSCLPRGPFLATRRWPICARYSTVRIDCSGTDWSTSSRSPRPR